MQPTKLLKGSSIALTLLALLVVSMSALVRAEILPAAGYQLASGLTALLAILTAIAGRRAFTPIRLAALAGSGFATGHLAVALLLSQIGAPFSLALHLLLAVLTLGAAVSLTTALFLPAKDIGQMGVHSPVHQPYFRSILATLAGFLLILVSGTLVTSTGSAAACPDWPLCWGEIFPAGFTPATGLVLLHRFTVVLVGVLVAAAILQTRRSYAKSSVLKHGATALGLLFLVQVGLGGLYPLPALPDTLLQFIHLALTAVTWSSLMVMAAACYLTLETVLPAADIPPVQRMVLTPRQRAFTYFKLTKPWILVLLLLTTLTAMVIAARGLPSLPLMLYTLLGGLLSSGGASVLNSYVDSDIDQMMARTSRRGTVTGLVTPQETLIFGLILSALSFLIFAIFVNMFSAVLSTIGIIYYVFFYTLYLKRTTIHNIIIGGAAGAIPPLVGWTAVTNTLDLGALYLFAIIFFWTPPHTWALALMVKKDYAKARVPMLPVVVGEKETTYHILLYSILLIGLTLLPFTFNMLSWVYLLAASLLGARFLQLAWKLWQNHTDKRISRKLYKFSQAYLAVLFLVMALDRSLF